MFLKKTKKSKGIYLSIAESYYDKEKKNTRQKTIMGLGYVETLREQYPDPIAHFEQVVSDMNQERETRKNSVVYVDLTAALSPGDSYQRNVGYGVFKHLYKELQLDIFWRTKVWNLSLPYNMEEIFRYLLFSKLFYSEKKPEDIPYSGFFFEITSFFTSQQIHSALQVISSFQQDLQKWIYDHFSAVLERTSPVFVRTQFSFEDTLHLDLLTDEIGIPVVFDISTYDTMLNSFADTFLSRMKRKITNLEIRKNCTKGFPLASELAGLLSEAQTSDCLALDFTAFVLMSTLQAKLDFKFSSAQILSSLHNYNCIQIAGNIYQFTYYDEILAACEEALALDLHKKYRSQLQLRRLLRY